MNSQFSIGFVIALVIGVALGAFWPKYGPTLVDAANGREQNIREVSLTGANGGQRGHSSCGGCEKSEHGISVQCSGNKKSGRGQAGRGQGQAGRGQGQAGRGQGQAGRGQGQAGRGQGQAGRGQSGNATTGQCAGERKSGRGKGGRGCAGGCEGSGDEVAAQCAGNKKSGRGQGRRGTSTCSSSKGNGHCEQQAVSATTATAKTCQKSGGQDMAKGKCSDAVAGADCENALTGSCHNRNAPGDESPVDVTNTKTPRSETEQHGRGRGGQQFTGQRRGFGPGLGLGLSGGHGWPMEVDQTDAMDADDKSQAAEND